MIVTAKLDFSATFSHVGCLSFI